MRSNGYRRSFAAALMVSDPAARLGENHPRETIPMESWRIENCVIYVCTTAIILGGFALGGGGWSLWGLLLIGCVNSIRVKPDDRG